MMKKLIPALAVFAIIALSAQAYAAPKGAQGAGQPGLTADQQTKAQQIVEKHQPKLLELREKMWAKNTELQALTTAGKAEKADIQALIADITALRTAMTAERTAMGDELQKATGLTGFGPGSCPGFGPGYGMAGGGCGGGGRGPGSGRGFGPGGCGY